MSTQLAALLAAQPADRVKLAKLVELLGPEFVDMLLASTKSVEASAMAAGVSYKGARPALSPIEELGYDLVHLARHISQKSYAGAHQLISDALGHAVTRWPKTAAAAFGESYADHYAVQYKARLKSTGARPRQMRIVTLLEQLGDQMDDGAYAALTGPIEQRLQQALQIMQQGGREASQQAAAAPVSMGDMLGAAAKSQAREAQMIQNMHSAAGFGGRKGP